LAHLEQNV